MKKLLVIICSTFVFTSVLFAQSFHLELSSINPTLFSTALSDSYFYGTRLGLSYEKEIKKNWGVLTGIGCHVVYSDKTQKYYVGESVRYQTFQQAIDLPLRLTYTVPVSSTFKFLFWGGPKVSYGLNHFQKVSVSLSDKMVQFTGLENVDYQQNDLFEQNELNRLNLQSGLGGGMQWKQWQLKGGYDFGLNNLNKEDVTKRIRQDEWYVSLSLQLTK